jgi:hypothetical protein
MEGSGELFRGEDGASVLWVNEGVVLIPPFWVDVGASSEGVRLCTKFPRAKTNKHVESREVFRPASLAASEHLGSGKILEILVVCNDVDDVGRALEVVTPDRERLKDCKEFFVVCIVVELGWVEGTRVESDRVKIVVGGGGRRGRRRFRGGIRRIGVDRDDCSDSIVGGISFNGDS